MDAAADDDCDDNDIEAVDNDTNDDDDDLILVCVVLILLYLMRELVWARNLTLIGQYWLVPGTDSLVILHEAASLNVVKLINKLNANMKHGRQSQFILTSTERREQSF